MIALYPRVSTQEQAAHGYSIKEQTERMANYCKAMGWGEYRAYTDAGFSGANMERPGLQALIEDARAGKIEKVLVYKLDRLSRSQRDTLYLIEDVFLANGVDFVSMSENFDTSTPLGRAMIGILAVFAQLEREQIRERLGMGSLARAKSGLYKGNDRLPIGYDYIGGELIKNDEEAPQVHYIFERYAAGASLTSIERELKNNGLRHKNGEWRAATIRHILTKKTYIGYVAWHGEWYKGIHEPIVEQELFDRVQKRIENTKPGRKPWRATTYLGGFLYCGCCGAKYTKATKRYVSGDVAVYMCSSRSKKSRSRVTDPSCRNKIWDMRELDTIVLDEIKKLQLEPDKIDTAASDMARLDMLEKELQRVDRKTRKLLLLYETDGVPQDILQARIAELQSQKDKLTAELEATKKAASNKLEAASLFDEHSLSAALDTGDFDGVRSIISALIDRIILEDDNVTIIWNFSSP